MLEVFDVSRKKTAVLENAFAVKETREITAVWSMEFSIPDDDPKLANCQMLHYVRYDGGQMYRILTSSREKTDVGVVTFQCEHCIGTLIDDVMFGSFVYGNIGIHTSDVIRYVLAKQSVTRWVLGECDFDRQFEYAWSNENLLTALFTIPNRFSEYYTWVYDTSTFPWKVSLKRIDETAKPELYIRDGWNFLSGSESKAPDQVCTRLYCLGYGEGVNQLTIKDVNGGLPYLQSPAEIVRRYSDAPISRIWTDRRFEDAQSLKERGIAILAQYQEPVVTRAFNVADLYELTRSETDRIDVAKIVMLTEDNTKTYITKVVRNYDDPGDVEITISNKGADIVSDISDLADRLRTEEVYAQGATQLYAVSIQANATPQKGAVLRFYVPEEMRILNAVKAKITLDLFRSYSRATEYSDVITDTTSAGGAYYDGSERTSSSGGGETITSEASSTRSSSSSLYSVSSWTSAAGGHSHSVGDTYSAGRGSQAQTGKTNSHYHYYYPGISHTHGNPGTSSVGNHQHQWSINLQHTHDISHTHTVTTRSHSHRVSLGINIPDHTHSVNIPAHQHEIEQGIFEFGGASSANIFINGSLRASMNQDSELDITRYCVGSDNKVPRGSWQEIEVKPNNLAYVTIDLFFQGFVQSKGGSTH